MSKPRYTSCSLVFTLIPKGFKGPMSPHPNGDLHTPSLPSLPLSLLPLRAQGNKLSPVGHLAPNQGAGRGDLIQLSPDGGWQHADPCGPRLHNTHTRCCPLPRPGYSSTLCLLFVILPGHGPQTRYNSDTTGGEVPERPFPPTSLAPCWGLLPETHFCLLPQLSHTLADGNVTQQCPGDSTALQDRPALHCPVPATEACVLSPA